MSPKSIKPSKLVLASARVAAKAVDLAPEPSPLAKEIDELGDLNTWAHTLSAATAAAKFDRIEVLRKTLRDRFKEAPEEQRAEGARFVLLLGTQGASCNVSFVRAGSRTLKIFGKSE